MFLVIYCFHFVSSLNVCICFVTLNMGFDTCTQKHRKRKRDQPICQSLICFLSISFQNGMFSLCLHSFFSNKTSFFVWIHTSIVTIHVDIFSFSYKLGTRYICFIDQSSDLFSMDLDWN